MPNQKQLDHEKFKLDHEKFTAQKIVSLCGEAAQFDRWGDPNQREPDVIFSAKDILGIEVTLASYQGDQDDPDFYVREQWKFVKEPTFDEQGIHRTIDPKTGRSKGGDRMIERLQVRCQKAIDQKCSKTYQGIDRLWLGIYVWAPPTEPHEHDLVAQNLVVPNLNPFGRLFLLHRIVTGYRALQIFPVITSYIS